MWLEMWTVNKYDSNNFKWEQGLYSELGSKSFMPFKKHSGNILTKF